MSSTPAPIRSALRTHADPAADTPGATAKKKKKAVTGTPARKTARKKADDAAAVTAVDSTPARTSLDRVGSKTPKNKLSSSVVAGAGEATAKKSTRAGASAGSKKTASMVKQQPRLKTQTTAPVATRLSRAESPAAIQHPSQVSSTPAPRTPSMAAPTSGAAHPRHSASPSLGRSVLSPGATSTLSTSSVGVGRRFQPSAYKRMFAVAGSYSCLECVPQTASLWVGDAETGTIEIYNGLTGHLTTTISAPGGSDAARSASATYHAGGSYRRDPLSQSVSSQRSGQSMMGAGPTLLGPTSAAGATPTALKATSTHMFVGYSNGTVAIYDFLVLQFVTEGCFHTGRVIDLCVLKDGTVVSASDDGALVHWDRESSNFEATTRVLAAEGTSDGRMTCIAAATPPSSTTRGNHVVLCGFHSGDVLLIDVSTGRELQALHGHAGRVLGIAVIGELLFTTAEDGAVLVWSNRVGEMLAPATSFAVTGVGRTAAQRCQPLRRIPVEPVVTALLPDPTSGSLWVAFADGLLERWSAQPDDDFGVEEVVREGMVRREAGTSLSHHPTRLLAMGAADTLQVLALSSNGVNKVWYGHRNTLEEHLSASIHALNTVIEQDAEDTAAWRERLTLLKQKEVERKSKYVVILEQLSELRVLLDYFDRWRQYRGARKAATSGARQATALATRADFALTRRYFSRWAAFYDWQQRRFRRHLLARALEEATHRAQISHLFLRWQAGLVQRRLVRSRLDSVRVMANVSADLLRSKAYYQWRQLVHRRHLRKQSTASVTASSGEGDDCGSGSGGGVTPLQLNIIAAKAQRQVLARSMARWQQQVAVSSARGAPSTGFGNNALHRYAALLAKLEAERTQRSTLQLWRRWVPLRQRRRALAAVATLRSQQAEYVLQQDVYYRWVRFAFAARLRATAREIEDVQQKLRQAEAEHGDIFEKLQLQKRIDQLIQEQMKEEAALAERQSSLRSLRDTYAAMQKQVESAAASVGGGRLNETVSGREASPPAVQPAPSSSSAGVMVAHADYYNTLVDEQRLSPAILSQMPLSDAIHHLMGQLKANTLNMYTDMALFRQVKDRRRAGTAAVAIFSEAFAEVKRLVTASSSPSSIPATRVARGGDADTSATAANVAAVRWPLCMEALDCIPTHHCASVLTAIKTLVVAFDLIPAEEEPRVSSTEAEIVFNADWLLLIARACYLRRRPLLPSNNR